MSARGSITAWARRYPGDTRGLAPASRSSASAHSTWECTQRRPVWMRPARRCVVSTIPGPTRTSSTSRGLVKTTRFGPVPRITGSNHARDEMLLCSVVHPAADAQSQLTDARCVCERNARTLGTLRRAAHGLGITGAVKAGAAGAFLPAGLSLLGESPLPPPPWLYAWITRSVRSRSLRTYGTACLSTTRSKPS